MEGREKKAKTGGGKPEFNKKCQELMRQMAEVSAMVLLKAVAEMQNEFNSDGLSLDQAEDKLASIKKTFDSGKWKSEASKSELPPLPPLSSAKSMRGSRGAAEERGVDAAGQAKDMFSAAGIDLQEESHALMQMMALSGGQAKNQFRGSDKDPVFCSSKAVRELMKSAFKSAGLSSKTDAKVEELMCIAIEMRMTQFLKQLARASRAGEEMGPVKIRAKPEEELKKLAGLEEVEQLRKARKLKEELEKLAETNAEDVRVRQMLDEQARQRAAAAASEAAIAMARGSKGKSSLSSSSAAAAAPVKSKIGAAAAAAPQPDAEVRVVQMKKAEGLPLTPEEEKMLIDWDRRSGSLSAGKRKVEEAKQRAERRVGMKELMFVIDSDPYFKSIRMQTSLKAGFLGRGVAGEVRVLLKE